MLEKMSDFFENRLDSYDEHMLTNIESAREFYQFTAECLPAFDDCSILDLGCGTGLELEWYLDLAPTAKITGIDLSAKMLEELKRKFPGKNISLICGSYFDFPLNEGVYDAAVSVESLHHFTKEEKTKLYAKLKKALKPGGYFILTDYFAISDEEERTYRRQLEELKEKEGISTNDIYHYDTPLTVQHEIEALIDGGFSSVQVLNNWGATYTLKAM